jgi:hypothetical protein
LFLHIILWIRLIIPDIVLLVYTGIVVLDLLPPDSARRMSGRLKRGTGFTIDSFTSATFPVDDRSYRYSDQEENRNEVGKGRDLDW